MFPNALFPRAVGLDDPGVTTGYGVLVVAPGLRVGQYRQFAIVVYNGEVSALGTGLLGDAV